MSAKLIAEEGALKGLVLTLNGGETWTIGRDPDNCEIVVEDPEAAKQQARCHKNAAGYVIENLSTENPTEINGDVLEEPYLLKEGDAVKIGSSIFRYQLSNNLEESLPESEMLEHGVSPEKGESSMSEAEKSHLGSLASGDESLAHSPSSKDEQNNHEDNIETAQEVLEDELIERNNGEKEENSTEQDDIFPSEEHAIEAAKYSAEGTVPSINNQTDSPNKDVMDTIFQDESTHKDNKDLIAEVNFDMLETGRWLLKVVGGPNTGAEFSMQAASSYLVGTDPNTCDIVFHDTSVSRQHARITISDEETLVLEDLKSRNGTMIEGKKIEGRVALEPNTVVSVGTTSFVVFDREGAMQTIISPMLPSIVKVLQQEEPTEEKVAEKGASPAPIAPLPAEVTSQLEEKPASKKTALGALLLISLVTGLFLVVGIGTLALFKSEPVAIEEPLNINATLNEALSPFKDVKYSYNQPSGRLLLVGHVLNATDKNQLIYNLQGLPFVKVIDDKGVVIDEFITREINPILARNKAWKGVTIQTPQPGQFVLSGYLQTREQAEQLSEYINTNFSLDQLDRRIVVEEEVTNSVDVMLQKVGIRDVQIKMNNGEITLTGGIPAGKDAEFNRIVEETKAIPGIRNVRSFVSELPAEASLVNISDRYKVSGVSNQGGVSLSVVINGRILSRGDSLDGMTVTSIKPNAIFLEKDGIKYRIDY